MPHMVGYEGIDRSREYCDELKKAPPKKAALLGVASADLLAPAIGIMEQLHPRRNLKMPHLLGQIVGLPGEEDPLGMGHQRQVATVGGAQSGQPQR